MKEKMNNKGFSLVELIIVIAIMAILVGVLAPQFIKYVERSRISTDMQNVESYKTAIEAYVADTGDDSGCTITVNGTSIAIPTTLTTGANAIQGVNSSTGLKSKKWPSSTVTYNYSASTGWSNTSYVNTSDSTDMATIFK